MKELKANNLYIFEGRILRLEKRPFHNKDKDGEKLRPVLILVKQEELYKILIKKSKGGKK